MRDDLLQPAFAIYNSPGVYALLLGSGVSRSAEIMTGWDIMRDLIRQIAAALKEEIAGTPEEWYVKHFGKEAGYDLLLEYLGQTPLDRNAILKDYIEPTEEDREENRKLPMPAHKAIAWLVKQGYVRVILTTNFDRLIETALQAEGIVPDVISTGADIETTHPLQHSPITVIKIHGDYRDEITKNTKTELADYSEGMKKLLQRVFSEYGLIVSGWSADWDTALKDVIASSKSKFATYWSWYGEQKGPTQQLFEARNAYKIPEIRADELFSELQNMVEALEGTKQEPPLTVAIAVERTKKLLGSAESRIVLDDMLHDVTERGVATISSQAFLNTLDKTLKLPASTSENILQVYYEGLDLPINIFSTLCFYGQDVFTNRIEYAVRRWIESFYTHNMSPKFYQYFPATLLIYSCALSAMYRSDWIYVKTVLNPPRINVGDHGERKLILSEVFNAFGDYFTDQRTKNPSANFYLPKFFYNQLKPVLLRLDSSLEQYNNQFDSFEVLIRLVYLYDNPTSDWMLPHGEFSFRNSQEFIKEFFSDGGNKFSDWDLLKAGFFDRSPRKLYDALVRYITIARSQNKQFAHEIPDYATIYSHNRDMTRIG